MGQAAEDAVRRSAVQALVRVEGGAWSDRILPAEEARFDARRDRAFLHVLVLTTLRWQLALDEALAPHLRRELASLDAPLRALLRLGLAQACLLDKPAPIAVSTSVSLARALSNRGGAGLVNAVLRKVLARGAPQLDPSRTLPGWLRERWTQHFGEERCRALAASSVRPARPFLVALVEERARSALLEELEGEGVSCASSRRVDGAWHVTRGVPQATRAFADGRVLLIDEGAALVASLAAHGSEGPIADLAAAPGGKATLLAHAVDAPLTALEPVASRARDLREALALRAPGRPWEVLRADARHAPLEAGSFGTVLLDAPCSGTGTLRRRPEKRHRLAPGDIASATRLQTELLRAAAALVKPAGHLVYAVCSLEPEEGREQVETFLAEHPEFEPTDPCERHPASVEGLVDRGSLLLETRPDLEDSEGFVACRLVRRPA